MKKLSLFLFTLLFVNVFNALAEGEDENAANKGTIAGRIVDTENLPLPGAAIVIEDLHKGAVTDVNGFYRIVALDPGDYKVKVSYIGFKETVKTINVTVGKTSTLNFQLQAGIDIEEVVVNGALQGQSKALNQQKSSMNITNIISSDQVGRFPDQNVGDALKRIPESMYSTIRVKRVLETFAEHRPSITRLLLMATVFRRLRLKHVPSSSILFLRI